MDNQPYDPASGAPDPNQPPAGGYTPGSGGQQPGGYAPPSPPPGGYAPPQGGYQPPPGGYAPPQGDPNQPPPYQPAGGGYGGGYGGGQQRKQGGFNWLACCGIGCGVVILITVLVCALMWKVVAPFVGIGVQAGQVAQEIQKTDVATIQSSAEAVDSAALAANPEAYKDKWVAVTGELGDQSGSSGQSYGGQQGTSYMLKDFVIVSDLSQAPAVGQKGDTITAYGKIVIMDLGAIPFLKKAMEDEAAKNPAEKVPTKFVMVFAKKVELSGGGGETGAAKDDGSATDTGAAPPDESAAPSDDSSSSSDSSDASGSSGASGGTE
jgi:hypothetical protein